MLSFASICPHPPIIIPKIGSKKDFLKTKKTIFAIEHLERLIEEKKPEVLIIVSPHIPVSSKELSIMESENFTGDFSIFGDQKTRLSFKKDFEFSENLKKRLKKENMPYRVFEKNELDHGTLVPLFYLTKNITPKLIPLGYSLLSLVWNFKYGNILGKTIKETKKKIAFVASGDLSHRITLQAPAGYSPKGKQFDEKLVKALKKNNTKEVLNINEALAEEAGECGLRSIAILLGVLSVFNNWSFKILSYENPFGVGYLVANIENITGS